MRAISRHRNYSIQLFEGIDRKLTDRNGNPYSFTESKPMIAQFQPGGLTAWEEETVFNAFTFTGLPADVHPLTTIAIFDVDAFVAWQPVPETEKAHLREKIEERLSQLAKDNPSQFIVVDKPQAAKPWPSYDEAETLKEIEQVMAAAGISPTVVREYELEHRNRAAVVNTMLDMEAEQADESIVVSL